MVRILKDLDADLTGRNVIIVEDIIDTGLTVLAGRQPPFTRSGLSGDLRPLRKREAAKTPVGVRYVGFDIPNEFVVGYGGLRGALSQPAGRRYPGPAHVL